MITNQITPNIKLLRIDCREYMATVPDKYYELAIVDPPYGLGIAKSPRIVLDKGIKGKDWDDQKPNNEYFDELFRISKNQIIWGGNYFTELWASPCKGFIIWDKYQPAPSFADCELAWTSFDKTAKTFRYRYYGNIEGETTTSKKIHPTQKPAALYKWLLKNYANPGDKILDTHLGSGSIAIACHDYNFQLTACELDLDYFNAATKRINNHIAQTSIIWQK